MRQNKREFTLRFSPNLIYLHNIITRIIMIEQHPWIPFIPKNAKIIFLGSFPPQKEKWGMDFYYPNKQNDFWRIIGKILHDKYDFYIDLKTNNFDKSKIIKEVSKYGIGLGDIAHQVRRLRNNASDKYLEIITSIDIITILNNTPTCNIIVSTGQKAAEVISKITSTEIPAIGCFSTFNLSQNRTIKIFRMPSTSRAYPLSIEKKTSFYKKLLLETKII